MCNKLLSWFIHLGLVSNNHPETVAQGDRDINRKNRKLIQKYLEYFYIWSEQVRLYFAHKSIPRNRDAWL